MCDTCGCTPDGNSFTLHNSEGIVPLHIHEHENEHSHSHSHIHTHDHDHRKPDFTSESNLAHEGKNTKQIIHLETDILSKNNLLAERNRGYFEAKNITCYNLVSSPGSGKTTLLEQLISQLNNQKKIFVIEGDQQTTNDADRIIKAGAKALQINTGNGCHLDAHMVNHAVKELDIPDGSLLFIENVGNLVCPALFDLGENKRILIASTTEGEDKPLKYPNMFRSSQLCVLNKIDLLPYLDFNVDLFIENAQKINPAMPILSVSAKTGDGLGLLIEQFI